MSADICSQVVLVFGKIQPLVGLLVLREGLLTNIQFERIMFNSPLVFKGKVTFNLLRLRKGSEVF